MQNEQEYSDGQIPISPFRADTSDNDPFSSEGGGSAVRKTGRLQYGSHCLRNIIRTNVGDLSSAEKGIATYTSHRRERRRRCRGTSQKSSRKSKGFASRSDTGIRRYAQQHPETFMPPAPPEPSVRRNSSSGSNPRTPPPKQYPAISCAEKLRPDETKIPKTTTNRMKIYSFRILQIEIFYLFLSKCFPLMEKRPDQNRTGWEPRPSSIRSSLAGCGTLLRAVARE